MTPTLPNHLPIGEHEAYAVMLVLNVVEIAEHVREFVTFLINNGNRTEWSPW